MSIFAKIKSCALTKAVKRLLFKSLVIFYAIRLQLSPPPDKKSAIITLYSSSPSSDTIPLLEFLSENSFATIYLATNDKRETLKFLPILIKHAGKAEICVVNSKRKKWEAFKKCRLVIWQFDETISVSWLCAANLGNGRRRVVKLYHGLITKGRNDFEQALRIEKKSLFCMQPATFSVAQGAIEGYNRAWLENSRWNSTEIIKCLGYPRFYRANALRWRKAYPSLSSRAIQELEKRSQKYRIFYAPTREPSLFDGMYFDWNKVEGILQAINACLFVKLHVQYMRQDKIFPVSDYVVSLPSFSSCGSLDLLANMNCLLTDRSSVMMEAAALDIPIVHIDLDAKEKNTMYEREIAYPGYIVQSNEELAIALEDCQRRNFDLEPTRKFFNLDRGGRMESHWKDVLI